jgi:hypothetical protein
MLLRATARLAAEQAAAALKPFELFELLGAARRPGRGACGCAWWTRWGSRDLCVRRQGVMAAPFFAVAAARSWLHAVRTYTVAIAAHPSAITQHFPYKLTIH